MTRTLKTSALTLAVILAAGMSSVGTAHAEWYRWNGSRDIDARQRRQIEQIENGLRDGSLTRHEANRLIDEQRRITELERRAKADGYLDHNERARLRAAQDDAARHIYVERHDSEVARPWYRHWWSAAR